MRRLLIILLLTLLPIQASWAAVCAYCPDNCIAEFVNLAAAEESPDDANAAGDDDNCSRCQLGGIGIPTSPAVSRIAPPPTSLTLFDAGPLLEPNNPDRPERPKWTRAA